MEQRLIIPYSWEGIDFTPKSQDEMTGDVVYGEKRYRIFVFGHDQYNNEVSWVIEDFYPHCYVKIETPLEDEQTVGPLILQALNDNLRSYVEEKSKQPSKAYLKGLLRVRNIIIGYEPDKLRPLFYYTTQTDQVYKVFFSLDMSMKLCYEYLDNRSIVMPNGIKIKASAYNNGVSDRIPTEEKMLVERKLERSSWIFAQAMRVEHDGLTTNDFEYGVSYHQLQPMPLEYASQLGYPKPSTITLDAEMNSHVIIRFPKASRLDDQVYCVGYRHRKYNSLKDENPVVTNYIFVIWDNKQYGDLEDFSHKYGKSIYIYCLTEEILLTNLFEYVIRLNPTFINSYNGLGFDWDYIEQRCDLFGIKIPNMSKIRGWYKSQFIRKTWKKFSSAWPQYPGRVDIDMLYILRIQFKFNSYKLKAVVKILLPESEDGSGHTKVELSYKDQFKIYASKDRAGMNLIMDYIHEDIRLPEELYDKLAMPVYFHANASVMRVNGLDLYTDGQSKRSICQLYYQSVEDKMYINSREIMECGKYIGGLVLPQKAGIFDEVMTWDFNSLYPSEMKANNICYSTIINEKRDVGMYTDDDCHVVEGPVHFVDKKTKLVTHEKIYRFRYIKKTTFTGLLPKIVTKLNKTRSEYKKPMEAAYAKSKEYGEQMNKWQEERKVNPTEENRLAIIECKKQMRHWKTEGDIWNVKQNAVKTSANSMYGFMGMKTGKFSFIEGGMSTTLAGRDALRKTLHIITSHFGAVLVYGDTDSVMVCFPPDVINRTNYLHRDKEIAKYISDQFAEEINIVRENYFPSFISLTAKRYAAIKINPKNPLATPTREEIKKFNLLYVKGVASVRGNSCGVVYKNFDPMLVNILLNMPVTELLDSIFEMCLKIMRHEYPMEDYIFRQKLGADYSKESNEMAIFSEKLKQQGRTHKPGEELEFLFVRMHGRGKILSGHRMQVPDLYMENDNVLDTLRYVTNKIGKPIEQLLCAVHTDDCLTAWEKKIIHPRKPTKVQKVTKVWHLQDYIRKLVAVIHERWRTVTDSIKFIGNYAETLGVLTLPLTDDTTRVLMAQKYGIDWTPRYNAERARIVENNKHPLHRHAVWDIGYTTEGAGLKGRWHKEPSKV